jgi:hypothetical protein
VMLALAPFLVIFVYFSASSVFFERNLSQSLAVLATLFGVGATFATKALSNRYGAKIATVTSTVIAVVAIGGLVVTSHRLSRSVLTNAARWAAIEVQRTAIGNQFHHSVEHVGWMISLKATCQSGELVEVAVPGELIAKPFAKPDSKWVVISQNESVFAHIVPSTLHTYISPTIVWLRCKDEKK